MIDEELHISDYDLLRAANSERPQSRTTKIENGKPVIGRTPNRRAREKSHPPVRALPENLSTVRLIPHCTVTLNVPVLVMFEDVAVTVTI